MLVIGSPGAGKSTFVRALAGRTGLPLVHLDAEYHLPGWVDRPDDEWHSMLDGILAREAWIIDGNDGASMDRWLARADTAILLDYTTLLCLWRVLKRVTTLRGQVRPAAAPGCSGLPRTARSRFPRLHCRLSPGKDPRARTAAGELSRHGRALPQARRCAGLPRPAGLG